MPRRRMNPWPSSCVPGSASFGTPAPRVASLPGEELDDLVEEQEGVAVRDDLFDLPAVETHGGLAHAFALRACCHWARKTK
jgi:hypothetical protein